MKRADPVAWQPFVAASLLLAITGGFGLGAFLMEAAARHAVSGAWWEAAAQAHGHLQVFGWAGLMVIGVSLHVLPRLRGTSLAYPNGTRLVCALLVIGLVARTVSQPVLAATPPGRAHVILGGALVGSGVLELSGACVLLWLLGATLRRGPSLRARAGLWSVLPFFVSAFGALWLALAVNLIGLIAAVWGGQAVAPDGLDDLTAWIGFYAFLVPVSLAMSARTFPIFLRTALPRLGLLRAALAALLGGLVLRVVGDAAGSAVAAGSGRLALAAALALGIAALGVFGRRRPLPREQVATFGDPIRLQMLSAYAWLAVVIVLLAWSGLNVLGVTAVSVGADAERHALGSGFVTLLILGAGAFLLPGMTDRRRLSWGLLWATGACANAAALLRVVPAVAPGLLPGSGAAMIMSLAGVVGLAALALFALNVVMGRAPTPAVRGSRA